MNVFSTRIAIATRPPLEALVRDHYDSVWRFAARRVGVDLASDVAQETFLTVQTQWSRFGGRSAVRTWVFGIALNHCREIGRRNSRELLEGPMLLEDAETPSADLVGKLELEQALAKLSTEHREVVILHELEGLTYEEIGTLLSVPSGTVKSRLHHAFVALRKTLTSPENIQ